MIDPENITADNQIAPEELIQSVQIARHMLTKDPRRALLDHYVIVLLWDEV